jgi:hypothetical protein
LGNSQVTMNMKPSTNYLMPALTFLLSLFLTNCGSDPVPLTSQQLATKSLSGTWGSAQVLAVPIPGAVGTLNNLVLTFGSTDDQRPAAFSASGMSELFTTTSSSGWSWESSGSTTGILLSNVSTVEHLTVEFLDETTLTIRFAFAGPVGGRLKGIGELYNVRLQVK